MEGVIKSPSVLWEGFEADNPLNVSVIKEYEVDGVLVKHVYYSSEPQCDGTPRVYGVYAVKNGAKRASSLMLCHDVGETVNIDNLIRIAKAGYAAFSFDYSGENENVERYTLYPKTLDYCNYLKSGEHLKKAMPNAVDTCYYQWTVVAKYSLEFLKQQPEINKQRIAVIGFRRGGYFAYQLASFSSGIRCGVSIFECGYQEYKNVNKYGSNASIEVDAERERWLTGISTQSYAMHVKVPFLYLGGTNDLIGNIDRISDTINKLPCENFVAIAPKGINSINADMANTVDMFFSVHLEKEKNIFPKSKPQLSWYIEDRKVKIKIDTGKDEIEKYKIYVGNEMINPKIRSWCEIDDDTVKCLEGQKMAFAIAEVWYKNGLYLTTLPMYINLEDVDVERVLDVKTNMIYSSSKGIGNFTTINYNMKKNSMVYSEDTLKLRKGAFDIMGIGAKNESLATFIVSQPKYQALQGSSLKFDICCEESGKLRVVAVKNYGTDMAFEYSVTVDILGGDLWQKVDLVASNFKCREGTVLESFKDVELLVFDSEEDILLNNMLWL